MANFKSWKYSPNENYFNNETSSEELSLHILHNLQTGMLTISDLMGPLYGNSNLTSNSKGRKNIEDKLNHNNNNNQEEEEEEEEEEEKLQFLPNDNHNQKLLSNVYPNDYINPYSTDSYDLVVIGAGVAGLLSVITAKWLGKKCALIERDAMGGDCLNIGCVPSKAFISSAKLLREIKLSSSKLGIHIIPDNITIDFQLIMERMRKIRADISPHDSVQRYSKEFCKDVYLGSAKFTSSNIITVTSNDGSIRNLQFNKAMIATGARANIPSFLQNIPHLTNKNFFNLSELPPRIVVIGCGPISLELSQALSIYGSQVICLEESDEILHREDIDAAKLIHNLLEQDGVTFMTHTKVLSISINMETINNTSSTLSLFCSPWPLYHVRVLNKLINIEQTLTCEALLNATGRTPNIHNLGLEEVNVSYNEKGGVIINDYFQTTNENIYSCGDCASVYKFTHAADFQARLAIRNMFLNDHNRLSDLLIPWCTYTHPEIAHVGKYEYELQDENIPYETFTRYLEHVDRCRCDGVENGFVKMMISKNSQDILGCTIVAPAAGDMISEVTVCMQYGIGIAQLAGVIHPYPTTQEAIRQCALQYYKYYKDVNNIPLKSLNMYMNQLNQNNEIINKQEQEEQEQEQNI